MSDIKAASFLLDRHPGDPLVTLIAAHLAGGDPTPRLRVMVEELEPSAFADLLIALGIARGWIDC